MQLRLVGCLILLTGCLPAGSARSNRDGGGFSPDGGGPQDLSPEPEPMVPASTAPLRRMSHAEYSNSVKVLFNTNTDYSYLLPADDFSEIFSNQADTQNMTDTLASAYFDAASAIALSWSGGHTDGYLMGCTNNAVTPTCVTAFVTAKARRIWRRDPTADEIAMLSAFYNSQAIGADGKPSIYEGAKMVVARMLASPYFIYRPEFGAADATPDSDGTIPLSGYEIASRLSYFLWASTPDDTLLDAAKAGTLNTTAGVNAQITRMLGVAGAPERASASANVKRFFDEFFALYNLNNQHKDDYVDNIQVTQLDANNQPVLSNGQPTKITLNYVYMYPLLQTETEMFVDHVMFSDDGKLSTLLTANYSFLDYRLASFYQLSSGPTHVSYDQYTFPTNQGRAGILTHGSVMAMLSHKDVNSPTERGEMVLTKLLCEPPQPPPANAATTLAPDPSGMPTTLRQKLETLHAPMSADGGECYGCHSFMDPIGFGFEHFNIVGQRVETDNGLPIDPSGSISLVQTSGGQPAAVPFVDVAAMAPIVASSSQAQNCIAEQWFRYALGRDVVAGDTVDAARLAALQAGFQTSGGNMYTLLAEIATSPAFLRRTAYEGGQ